MADADWKKIRKEYLKSNISLDALAEKYGLPKSALYRHSKNEGWVSARKGTVRKTIEKISDTVVEENGKCRTMMQTAALAIVEKAIEGINNTPSDNYKAINGYASALKNVKDILDLKSRLDIKEQEARIENLRRQAEKGEEKQEISIEMEEAVEQWAK